MAPEAFQKWGHKFRRKFFYCATHFFVVPPWQGMHTIAISKVQGTVTRTELGQRWPTVRGQSNLWLFSHAVSKVTSPVDRAWSLGGFLYWSSVDTNSVSSSISEILHLNPQIYFWPISINQSINQHIYNAPWYRGACYSADYAEAKRNVLSRVLNVSTDGAVRQFRGSEFQSLGAMSNSEWQTQSSS